jgi:hypothetical protein
MGLVFVNRKTNLLSSISEGLFHFLSDYQLLKDVVPSSYKRSYYVKLNLHRPRLFTRSQHVS